MIIRDFGRALWAWFLSILWFVMIVPQEGFVKGTLICTPNGYACIQDLSTGDEVTVYDFEAGGLISTPITHISNHKVEQIIQVHIGSDVIEMAENQLMYSPLQRRWIFAGQIEKGVIVLGVLLQRPMIADAVMMFQKTTCVYTISLAHHHNYLVGKDGILVHNFAATGAITFAAVSEGGLFVAFLAANPIMAPLIIGVSGVGLVSYFIWKSINSSKQQQNSTKRNNPTNSGPQNRGNNNGTPETAAAFLPFLKSLEENKEKALEVFRNSYEWLQTPNGFKAILHCFRDHCEHNFGPIFARMGGQTEVNQLKFIAQVTQKVIDMGSRLIVDENGIFERTIVECDGELITVQGRIIDGIFKISTMFIKPEHVR